MKRLLLLLPFLIGCGDFDSNQPFEPVTVQPDPEPIIETPDNLQESIDLIVSEENEYRSLVGQTMLSKGLSCKFYTITGGQRIQSTSGPYQTLQGKTQIATFLNKTQAPLMMA
jgi:hypothetical protein